MIQDSENGSVTSSFEDRLLSQRQNNKLKKQTIFSSERFFAMVGRHK